MACVKRANFLSRSFIGFLCKPRNISLFLSSIFLSSTFFPSLSLNQSPMPFLLRVSLDPAGGWTPADITFPVVMYRCESWTVKKAERQRIDAFQLWCWKRLLRVPWTARRSNPSIRKEISPGCLSEGLMLKLKLQYFGHLMRRTDSLEKTLMLGKIEGRRRGQQRMRYLANITDSMNMSLSQCWKTVKDGEVWHAAVHGVTKSWT